MVKLTPELIQTSYQHINAVRDRELDLRGYKIPMVENLGATLNQFDTIDLSDNDVRKVDNFTLLPRLKTLLMNNNRIVRCASDVFQTLPNLHTLILTNNLISELSEIDSLSNILSLRVLSLLYNPVSTKEHYRPYAVYRMPQLTLLDFRKIKLQEREDARTLFKSKKGKEIRKEIVKNAAEPMDEEVAPRRVQSAAEVAAIKSAIAKATSLDEIERLNQMLQSGKLITFGPDEGEMDTK